MRALRYESGTGSETLELDGPLTYVGTATGLRGRAWSYELGYRGISGVSRPAREASVDARFTDLAEYDRARRVLDRDVAMRTPGELVYAGEWRTRAYVVKSELKTAYRGYRACALTVVLLDGVWRKPVTMSFNPSLTGEGEFLDLPYDLPYDLVPVAAATETEGPEWMPSPCVITVYGQATNPEITIGGNLYAVDCTVPQGGYLVIDGMNLTVTEVAADGTRTNRLDAAHLGSGEGSGEYAFEPIKPGVQPLSWSHAFGFDLTYYIEESEPPCSW